MQQQLRDWIVNQLQIVPNVGIVHSYQRYADREKQLADLYTYNNRLHGWFIRRLSVVEKPLNASFNTEQSTWLIRGYLAINDVAGSEIEFDELLDAVRTVFRVNAGNPFVLINNETCSLLFNEQTSTEQIGYSITDYQPVLFAGVLCHSAECQLVISRNIST